MFSNIGLKLKVFFFILTVFSLLSVMDFYLFDNVLNNIQLQQGPENTYKYLQTTIVNEQFSLISQAFKNSRTIKLTREATKKGPFILDTQEIKDASYLIVEKNGTVIASNVTAMENMKGIPAVDRALTQGIASDGIISIKGKMNLLGVVPFTLQGKRKKHFFVLIQMKPVMDILKSFPFTFPVRAYFNNKIVYETKKSDWKAIFPLEREILYKSKEKELLASNKIEKISRWTMLASHSIPADFRGTSKITVVGLLSYTPGFAAWKHLLTTMIIYGLIAAFISLLFVFIVTHEIDKVFRKLSTSLSALKVGEKIVSRNHVHGAEVVVSALNTLISKYLATTALNASQQDGMHENFEKQPTPPAGNGIADLEENFSVTPEDSSDTDFSLEDSLDDTMNDEKTMLAGMPMPSEQPKSPFDILWDEYRSIKVANGHRVSEADKLTFINKLKTQKVSIIAKYNCSDVHFSIEEKQGKPVIKAKKVT